MTVCTASVFSWIYDPAKSDMGPALITSSDRRLTDEALGIGYEGRSQKLMYHGSHRLIMVAGDLSFNSLVLQAVLESLPPEKTSSTTQLAVQLGDVVSRLNADRSHRRFLGTLGLSRAAIEANEKGLSGFGLPTSLIEQIADQMQRSAADFHAIVAGCDGRVPYLFHVDALGIISSHIDIGFLSIGSGHHHAVSYFMQRQPQATKGFHSALRDAFFSKKRSEIDPGVGPSTDIHVITADGIERIGEADIKLLEHEFGRYQKRADALLEQVAGRLEQRSSKGTGPRGDEGAFPR